MTPLHSTTDLGRERAGHIPRWSPDLNDPPHPPATRRVFACQGGGSPHPPPPTPGTQALLTYHEILHRNNLALAGTYTPSTQVLTRDITYLLTLLDRYARLVAAARATATHA